MWKKSVSVTRTPTHLIRASKPFRHIPEVFPELSRLRPQFFHRHISALRFRFCAILRVTEMHMVVSVRLAWFIEKVLVRSCQTLVLKSR